MSDDAKSVGIVGAGARTAVGRSLPACSAAVRAGIGHFTPHPFLSDRSGRRVNVARSTYLSADVGGAARFVGLATSAAKEALEPVAASRTPIRLFLGLPETRPGRPEGLDAAITRALSSEALLKDRIGEVVLVPEGHASALVAFELACQAIQRGEAELCLVGGVDTWLEPTSIDHLLDARRLHGPSRPWGFVPGEGAAFCLVASPRWLAESGTAAPLSILAAVSSTETATIHEKRVCTGAGLSDVFERALLPLRKADERASRLIGDLNGEPYRTDELGFALARSSDALERPDDIVAPAGCWGDVGAASGALFAGLAFADATRSGQPRSTTLVWGSSEGGRRAAALFRSTPPIEAEDDS